MSQSAVPGTQPARETIFRWLLIFLGIGLLWRLVRFVQGIPFWGDEAYLLSSILHQDYAGLLREPLEYGQVAPLLFVWTQRFLLEQLGGGEYAMRLAPIVGGVAALLLLADLAWRALPPRAAAYSVAIYAVSYRVVRHTTESKPYGIDGFVAVLLLWTFFRWWRAPANFGRGAALLAAGALGVWLSYPAIFIVGAIGIVIFSRAIAESRRTSGVDSRRRAVIVWSCCAIFGVAVGGSFLAHYLLYAGPQSARTSGTWLEEYWSDSFPPATGIIDFARWLIDVHTGRMFGYPIGGALFTSSLTTVCFLAGVVWMLRRRNRIVACVILLSGALTLLAALLHKYPYGGAARLSQHLAPLICLAAGAGLAAMIEWIRKPAMREALAGAAGLILLSIGVGGLLIDCIAPRRSQDEDEWVRPTIRALAARIATDDVVVCLNPPAGEGQPDDGPRFDPVARYYLELYRGRPPLWMAEQRPPAETRWVLAYVGLAGVPNEEHVRARIAECGFRVIDCQTRRLSATRPTQLLACRVEAATR